MGQTPSKKIGRTKSKELSHYDSFSKRSSSHSTSGGGGAGGGDTTAPPPMAGNLVIPPLRPGNVGESELSGSGGGMTMSTTTSGSGLEVSTPGARKTLVGGGVVPPGPGVRGRTTGGASSGAAAAGAAVQGRSKSPPPSADTIASSPPDEGEVGPGGASAFGSTRGSSGNGAGSTITAVPSSSSSTAGGSSSQPPQIPTTQTITAPHPSSSSSSSNPFRSASPPPPSAMMSVSPQSSLSVPPGSINAPSSSLSTSPSPLSLSQSNSGSTGGPTTFNRTLDVDNMISRLLEAGYSGKVTKSPPLKNAEITAVCLAAREVFLSQPTLIELSPPVKIVGDVHGQYADLIRLFEMCGFPPAANYLFLGDYVDRGKQSLETILLLLCYKIKYPENFFLLRGNHECANVTRVYGFYDECKRRTNIKTWKTFIDVFNTLPIASIVASKIFCVHGGLSPSLTSMDDIRRIQRPTDVPDYGLLNDLVWSDPSDTALEWEDNERGVSYCYGKAVINSFLATHDMDLICRAHMVVEDGYEFYNDRTLVTVFSAPNYCGEFDNFAAVMSVSEDLLCSFELLKPLDGAALKKEMAKNKRKSLQQHQSPPNTQVVQTF